MRSLRVAIVAVSPLVQAGLAQAIGADPRFELVTVAPTLQALRLSLVERPILQFDVALIEAGGAGEAVAMGAALDANVGLVILSDADPALLEPLVAGGAACLPTSASDREIAAAIEAVSAGLVAMRSDLFNELVRRSDHANARRPPVELVEPLTSRELQVLRLLAGGRANKRIAHDLGISEHTAKFHVGRILDKLDAATRAEAVAIGLRDGLIAAD